MAAFILEFRELGLERGRKYFSDRVDGDWDDVLAKLATMRGHELWDPWLQKLENHQADLLIYRRPGL